MEAQIKEAVVRIFKDDEHLSTENYWVTIENPYGRPMTDLEWMEQYMAAVREEVEADYEGEQGWEDGEISWTVD